MHIDVPLPGRFPDLLQSDSFAKLPDRFCKSVGVIKRLGLSLDDVSRFVFIDDNPHKRFSKMVSDSHSLLIFPDTQFVPVF